MYTLLGMRGRDPLLSALFTTASTPASVSALPCEYESTMAPPNTTVVLAAPPLLSVSVEMMFSHPDPPMELARSCSGGSEVEEETRARRQSTMRRRRRRGVAKVAKLARPGRGAFVSVLAQACCRCCALSIRVR